MKRLRLFKKEILLGCFLWLLSFNTVLAQSNNIDNPTPVTSSIISGKINARDIGDPRSTVHYYVFEGTQGDISLKIESNNLNGDIDLFFAENLRPITKISLYADLGLTQTGREIYLRKPERLILKVEGRTPVDEAATYSIRFEGSFVALAPSKTVDSPKITETKSEPESEVRVNSVGTIIETKPRPTPTPKETIARNISKNTPKSNDSPKPITTVKPKTTVSKKTDSQINKPKEKVNKVEVVVSDNLPSPEKANSETETVEKSVKKENKPKTSKKPSPTNNKAATAKKETTAKNTKSDQSAELMKALENVRLIVEFKDGAKIERPMNDVLKFGVDKGVLTIVNKDGTIGRYSILEISKITIE